MTNRAMRPQNLTLFDAEVVGMGRDDATRIIENSHYTRSVPSGKSHFLWHSGAIVVWSIPANMNIGRFLLGRDDVVVWELSRLWAPDGHRRNLLTEAISATLRKFQELEPKCVAVVSYADPNAGHTGGVYRAASWHVCGQSEESRVYVGADGVAVARRAFHSGGRALAKSEIEARGFTQQHLPGKLRFARGLRPWARKELARRFP